LPVTGLHKTLFHRKGWHNGGGGKKQIIGFKKHLHTLVNAGPCPGCAGNVIKAKPATNGKIFGQLGLEPVQGKLCDLRIGIRHGAPHQFFNTWRAASTCQCVTA